MLSPKTSAGVFSAESIGAENSSPTAMSSTLTAATATYEVLTAVLSRV